MNTLIKTSGLAAIIALSALTFATQADASCQGRKTTGTILGGVGGALLGNAVSHGGGGAVVGGLGGAVVGHQIGKDGCNSRTAYTTTNRHYSHRVAYYRNGHRYYRYE